MKFYILFIYYSPLQNLVVVFSVNDINYVVFSCNFNSDIFCWYFYKSVKYNNNNINMIVLIYFIMRHLKKFGVKETSNRYM